MSLISLDKVKIKKSMNTETQKHTVDEMNKFGGDINQYVSVDENITTITSEGITEIETPEFTTESVTKSYEQIESSIKQLDGVVATFDQIMKNLNGILNMDSSDRNKYPLLRESANRLLSPSSFITSLINAEFGNKQYTDEELNKIRTDYTNQYNAYLKEKVNAELARINPDTNPEYYSALKDIADGNITFSEQYSNINGILVSVKKIRYDLVQEAKKKDYDLLATTDEYKNYIGDISMEDINTAINSWAAPYTMYDGTTSAPYTADNTSKIAEFRIFLTDEQKQMYYYLHETKGYAKAEEYLGALSDELNDKKGYYECMYVLNSLTPSFNFFNADGTLKPEDEIFEIEYTINEDGEKVESSRKLKYPLVYKNENNNDSFSENLRNTLAGLAGIKANGWKAFLEGLTIGFIDYTENIADVFAADGVISANDYAYSYLSTILSSENNMAADSLSLLLDLGKTTGGEVIPIITTIIVPTPANGLVLTTLGGVQAFGSEREKALRDGESGGLAVTSAAFKAGINTVFAVLTKSLVKPGDKEKIISFQEKVLQMSQKAALKATNDLSNTIITSFLKGESVDVLAAIDHALSASGKSTAVGAAKDAIKGIITT